MQKWEYMNVTGGDLNYHGAEGWEAVGVIESDGSGYSVLMKRRVLTDNRDRAPRRPNARETLYEGINVVRKSALAADVEAHPDRYYIPKPT